MNKITATLAHPPAAIQCTGGAWVMQIELRQAKSTIPIVGNLQFGHGQTARQQAETRAAQLTAGDQITVECSNVRLGYTADDRIAVEAHGIHALHHISSSSNSSKAPA